MFEYYQCPVIRTCPPRRKRFIDPTDTPYPKMTDAPYPKVTDAPYPKMTDVPYHRMTDAPYPRMTDAPYPKMTDAPYPRMTDAPYPKMTYTPYPKTFKPLAPSCNTGCEGGMLLVSSTNRRQYKSGCVIKGTNIACDGICC